MAEDPRTSRPEYHRGSYGYGTAAAVGPGYRQSSEHQEAEQGMVLPGAVRRISWGAIIAGTVVALVVYLMLSLLGIGIGATQIEPAAAQQMVPEGLGIGAAVWWILSILIALFIGGWLAGYLSGIPEKKDGAIHGIVTWALALLLSAWFATTAIGAVTAGAWNVVETGAGVLGQQQQVTPEMVEQIDDPQIQQQLQEAIGATEQDFEAIAEDVAAAVAQAGIWGFVGMLLAGIVAALGGLVGAIQTTGRTYSVYPGGERREERGREREREYDRGRYDYDRAERERAERERSERGEREGVVGGREGYEREREREHETREGYERGEQQPGEYEREQQRQRLERERAERERAERERERYDQP